jgi:hypothetical protein
MFQFVIYGFWIILPTRAGLAFPAASVDNRGAQFFATGKG